MTSFTTCSRPRLHKKKLKNIVLQVTFYLSTIFTGLLKGRYSLFQELIYMEFFSQGDLEKEMGNRPVESMDREKACIPKLQIEFISDIVIPVYR